MLISRTGKPSGGVIVVVIAIALFVGSVGAGKASAAEKSDVSSVEAAKKRDALLKIRDDALEDFYATKPEIKEELAKAVGYAVFDASQVNIVLFVGGTGGGVLVENETGKETFMKMRRVGTGPGIGYKSFRQLMIFKDRSLLDQFRTLGADVGASADATMKIGDKGVALAPNVSFNPLLSVYQITDRGVLLQANWALLHTSRTLASTRDRSGPCTQHCRVRMGTGPARRVLDKVQPKHAGQVAVGRAFLGSWRRRREPNLGASSRSFP